MKGSRFASVVASVLLSCAFAVSVANAETLTFQKAIELAMARSTGVGIAIADQMKAHSAYLEARNAYIPGVGIGSGLGASWGFPLTLEGSAPSIFNVAGQSTLLNFSQREFVRAARTEWGSSQINTNDQKNQVLLDTAVTFAQLRQAEAKLRTLLEQGQQADRAQYITQQRVDEGIDSTLELKRATLNAARTRMRLAEVQGNVDLLKQHLAQLTGSKSESIEIDANSMPALPELAPQDDPVSRAVANSAAIRMAEQHALSKEQQAKGERKALWPSMDFAVQYARLARYNNYDEFYKKFEPDNATVGVVLRFPFLNPVQRAKAEGAEAEALRAKSEADATRHQVASQTLKLQRTLQQLAAARDVAQMEYELAQGDLDAVTAKLQTGSVSLRDQENARIEVNDKYASFLDAGLEFEKVRLQLMSATGDLHDWALSSGK